MRSRTLTPLLSAAALVLATAGAAQAAPQFPKNIQSTLKLDYAPPCSVCHQYGKTGNGTPITPFAWSLRARGLTGSRSTLSTSLTLDQTDFVDSDGDGVTDVVEFEKGTDPNSPADDCIIPLGTKVDGGQCVPSQASPTLGCSVRGAGSATGTGATALFGLLAVLGAATRRRRTPRSGGTHD